MAMSNDASDLAHRLARNAEAVCRHYLCSGRREGGYWRVGDIHNTPGRSMYVRLTGGETGRGAAGKWADPATGEHGDLLDIIRETCGHIDFRDVADEARRFLSLPRADAASAPGTRYRDSFVPVGTPEMAQRLLKASRPIKTTVVEAYLRHRGITAFGGTQCLGFHPRCFYRSENGAPAEAWPAMIAAVTDLTGEITGVHRTWLEPSGQGKAPLETPRRAMGHLLGNAVRFGAPRDVLAAGEGIETILSLRCALPNLPMAAALSAGHLAAILFPPTLRRLYIVRDADPAGDYATETLTQRAQNAGIETLLLSPQLGDFNDDLSGLGIDEFTAALRGQLAPEDVARFMRPTRA